MEDATATPFVATVSKGVKNGKHIAATPNMGTQVNYKRITPTEKSATNF